MNTENNSEQPEELDEAPNLVYLGHSAVLLTSDSGKRFLIDPWLEGNPTCPEKWQDPGPIDYIVLTHGHSDHSADALSLALKYGALVFATFELGMLLIKEGLPQAQLEPMNKGGTVRIPGTRLSVSFTNAFHSSSYQTADGTVHYAGEPCGAVITLESGQTVYHAGDTCLFGDMKLIGETFHPDIALLPIGDRFTMGPDAAAQATRLINPKAVIPIHFGTFDMLTGTPAAFERLLVDIDVEFIPLAPGERYRFPQFAC